MKKSRVILIALIFAISGAVTLVGSAFADIFTQTTEKDNIVYISSSVALKDALADTENYTSNSKLILTRDITLSEGDLTSIKTIYSSQPIFYGEFDGDGYTIKNLSLTSNNDSYGFFSRTGEGAVIKNLRLDGKIRYEFVSEGYTQLYVGGIVGSATGSVIENCEIANTTDFISADGEEGLSFATKFNFGQIAGKMSSASLQNCVSHADVKLVSKSNGEQYIAAGGLAGVAEASSEIMYSISYGNISYFASVNGVTFYNGGLVGEISGQFSAIRNCVYAGSIDAISGSEARGLNGAVVGRVAAGNISHDYYSKGKAFGIGPDESNLTCVKIQNPLNSTFFANTRNWYETKDSWDFDSIWMSVSFGDMTRISLQRFQTFKYSFSTMLDNKGILEGATFSSNYDEEIKDGEDKPTGEYRFKFGKVITINLYFKPDTYDFYFLSTVTHDSTRLLGWEDEANKQESLGENGGYSISFIASDLSDGIYAFEFRSLYFSTLVTSENFEQGGVSYRGGALSPSPISSRLTIEGDERTVQAEGKGVYTFSHWRLYLPESVHYTKTSGNDQIVDAVSWAEPIDYFDSNSSLTFKIGPQSNKNNLKYFSEPFKLEAVFTDAEAMNVNFAKDDNILSIKFWGQDFEGEAIQAPSTSTKVDLFVTVKEGFELQVDRFISNVQRLYGSADASNIMPNDPTTDDEGNLVYRFNLSMSNIKNSGSSNEVLFNLQTRQKQKEDKNNLLWLWILLPIVGVLVIVGVVLFFVLRRYFYIRRGGDNNSSNNSFKKTKTRVKEKEQKDDYKDFYY